MTQGYDARVDVQTIDDSVAVVMAGPNSSRKGCIIYNGSGAVAYIKFGAAAASDSYTYPLADALGYELGSDGDGVYQGQITVRLATGGSGDVAITEW